MGCEQVSSRVQSEDAENEKSYKEKDTDDRSRVAKMQRVSRLCRFGSNCHYGDRCLYEHSAEYSPPLPRISELPNPRDLLPYELAQLDPAELHRLLIDAAPETYFD